MKKIVLIFLFAAGVYSCRQNTRPADKPLSEIGAHDPALESRNGVWFYRGSPYTGSTIEKYPNGVLMMRTRYLGGKENGVAETFYEDGEKESLRIYHNGEKDSLHTGWWPGGKKKFEYPFKKGNYDGVFREWYMSGAPAREIVYANGKELSGKEWRENGKLYTNFVWKGNRRYGVVNANMCYGVADGKVVD